LSMTKAETKELMELREKPSLEPNLWSKNGKLDPKIRIKLLKVAKDFFDSLSLDKSVLVDVQFTGSLVSFAWSQHSDIDLHLIIDFNRVPADADISERYFDAVKNLWNEQHEVMIKGYEVEVYVENVGSQHVSNGLYSLVKGAWLEIPTSDAERSASDMDVMVKADKWMRMVESEVYAPFVDGDHETSMVAAKELSKRFKRWRKCGLSKQGIRSVENLAYKLLRRRGYVSSLGDLARLSYDALLSLD
jgi:hypothetical protein